MKNKESMSQQTTKNIRPERIAVIVLFKD